MRELLAQIDDLVSQAGEQFRELVAMLRAEAQHSGDDERADADASRLYEQGQAAFDELEGWYREVFMPFWRELRRYSD